MAVWSRNNWNTEDYPEGTNLIDMNNYRIEKFETDWLPIVENRYV